jgi:hypothetical protein
VPEVGALAAVASLQAVVGRLFQHLLLPQASRMQHPGVGIVEVRGPAVLAVPPEVVAAARPWGMLWWAPPLKSSPHSWTLLLGLRLRCHEVDEVGEVGVAGVVAEEVWQPPESPRWPWKRPVGGCLQVVAARWPPRVQPPWTRARSLRVQALPLVQAQVLGTVSGAAPPVLVSPPVRVLVC